MRLNSVIPGHLSRGLLAVTIGLTAVAAPRAAQQADATGIASFIVLQGGVRVGSETVAVTRRGPDWTIAGSGRTSAPVDLVTTRFEATYASDWQPQRLILEGNTKGQPFALETTFGLTTARTEMTQGTARGSTSHQISARAIALPASFFGAYEALALRLASAEPGARLPAYVSPEGETTITVTRTAPKRVSVGATSHELREFGLTATRPTGPVPMEIWVDERGRLARLVLPASAIVVLREEFASVMAREERVHRDGDEDAFFAGNGFSIGSTISKPVAPPPAAGRLPAIVLVGPTGPEDRDLTLYGVSIFGHLAGSLADAGYLVLRYDPRGIGRSGGRTENASINEYVDDLLRVIDGLRKRKDVDGDRIAVAGYGEGAAIAMVAASKQKRIKAVALLAAPGRTGREVTLEQQQKLLARLSIPEGEKAARVALQTRVIDAAISGRGFDALPPDARAGAAAPWYRSWLLFDPAAVMAKMEQPVLVVHGALDRELDPSHADRLEAASRARKKATPAMTRRLTLPQANHLLVPATTGNVEEYMSLTDPRPSAEVARGMTEWLREVLPARR